MNRRAAALIAFDCALAVGVITQIAGHYLLRAGGAKMRLAGVGAVLVAVVLYYLVAGLGRSR